MGYFRILYYISYIFNTITRILKRHGKFVLWFLAIFIFLFFTMYSTRSHAIYLGNDDYSNAEYNITKAYNSVCLDFLRRFDNAKRNHTHDTITEVIDERLTGAVYDYYLFYGTYNDRLGQLMINGAPLDTSYVFIFMYPKNNGGFQVGASTYTNYLGNTCDIKTYKATSNRPSDQYFLVALDMQGIYYTYTIFNNEQLLIPSSLLHNSNQYIFDYFINNYSLQELELMEQMKTSVDNVENTINQTNEFLNEEPSDEDFSGEDLPSDSGVTDTTEEYTNTIFSEFYNTITGNYVDIVHAIDITIPFTNKHIKISGNYTKQYLPSALKDLISMFWYFAISILIYRDLIHKFNKIRSGDIEHVQDNNIKEDML